MGWKGVMRSVIAASRAAERESKRRQKELEREEKNYTRMLELDQAQHQVEVYENYVDRITSVHKSTPKRIDWQAVLADSPPQKPEPTYEAEYQARDNLRQYRPGITAKLFGRVKKTVGALENAVETAILDDETRYLRQLDEYESELKEWQEQTGFAGSVLQGSPDAYIQALDQYGSFSEIEELGSRLEFRVDDTGTLFCKIKVHSQEVIPSKSRSLLQSGKLSEKNLPKSQFYEIYQDYVCGVILRVANETFSLLPAEHIVVTATDDILNSSTGHIEEHPILSAFIPYKTLGNLNMEFVDPSDSMENFIHNMNFKKTQGFHPVQEVHPPA